MKFTDFNLKDTIQAAITDAGLTEPSTVQKDAIPLILKGHDMITLAQTCTGKTAAFGLPIMSMMKADGSVAGLASRPAYEW